MPGSPSAALLLISVLLAAATGGVLPAQQGERAAEAAAAGASGQGLPATVRTASAAAIGVVDFERVKLGVPRWKAPIENLRTKQDVLADELSSLQQQLREKELKRDSFEPNTIEYVRENVELQGSKQALQIRRDEYTKWIERARAELEDHFIRELKGAIAKVAAERGLVLVLRVRHVETDDGLGQRLQTFALNDVLWHAPTLDLTEDVIRILKSTSPGPASAPAEAGQGRAGREESGSAAGTAGADASRGK